MNLRLHCLLAGAAVVSLAAGCFTAATAQLSGSGTGLRYGMPDRATMSYVSKCLGVTPPRPVELYTRGGWYTTDDLREQLLERKGDIEGIAMVWKIREQPRAVYQWNHDGEFNRDVVVCLDTSGKVTRSVSHYTPGASEPDQRWVYIHTLTTAGHHGNLQGSGRYTDRQGHPRGTPHLTPEDQDFIAGERVYHRWTDFDFAGLVGTQER
ncbi:MAG TPA: hypothetical protein VHZ28_16405 [Terracidiphilus sp.]|nr:hypothetical protein [Terracidiphilus sp.]